MTQPDFASLPKALLHDHLDGGLRVDTVLDLAAEIGYEGLPETSPDRLKEWFHQGGSGSLEAYLESFEHAVAVLQTAGALERASYEAVADLSRDGVLYAELRFGPALHTRRGLTLEDTVTSVWRGVRAGMDEFDCTVGLILTALRNRRDSQATAALAVASRDAGVVGFDLAGPEAGFPCDDHTSAFTTADRGGVSITVHAGEGDGLDSVRRAITRCNAARIGHGVRVADDCVIEEGRVTKAGPLATLVRDTRIPLEVSVYSNLHTGMYPDPMSHPIGALYRFGCNVTINTDNRLMSDTSMTDEFRLLSESHGFAVRDFHQITRESILAGFVPLSQRESLLLRVDEAYEAAG